MCIILSPRLKLVVRLSSRDVALQGERLHRAGERYGRQGRDPQRRRGGAEGGRRSGPTVHTTQEEPHGENPGYQAGQRAQR